MRLPSTVLLLGFPLVPASIGAQQVASPFPVFAEHIDAISHRMGLPSLREDGALGRSEWELRVWLIGHSFLRIAAADTGVEGRRVIYWEAHRPLPEETPAEWDTVRLLDALTRERMVRNYGCPRVREDRGWEFCEVSLLPAQTWADAWEQLDSLGIRSLPDENDLAPPPRKGLDGVGLVVEFRNPAAYRTYSYWMPLADSPHPEVRHANGIMRLVNRLGYRADTCEHDSTITSAFLADFRYMLNPQAPGRGGIPIPLTPPDSIVPVSTGWQCFAALAAYTLKATPPGQDPIADSVAVIRIGDHHFAVVNPDVPDHESLEYMVFDASWSYQLIITP